jgi:hypothetical protein
MRLAACALLLGCGRIGFGTSPDGTIGDRSDANATGDVAGDQQGADAPLCTSLAQLTYNFDGTGGALWMPYQDPGMALAETGNQLVVTIANNKAGTAGYFSSCRYDLTGQRVFVTAAMVPRLGTNTDMYLAVGSQADAFGINVTAGNIQAYRIRGTNYTQFASVAYNASQHKVWQIREAGGTVFWEASSDGTSFTPLYSAAPPFSVTSVQLLLFGDAVTAVNNPGTAAFAKLNTP